MKQRQFLSSFVSLALLGCFVFAWIQPRNMVIIYGDAVALSGGDVVCYKAARVATPNDDRLASDDPRFTACYVVSSPPYTQIV